jgi:hypothetical protein
LAGSRQRYEVGQGRVVAGDRQRIRLRLAQLVLDEELDCGTLVVLPLGLQPRPGD